MPHGFGSLDGNGSWAEVEVEVRSSAHSLMSEESGEDGSVNKLLEAVWP